MKAIIEKIARKFEDFSSDLREIADDLPDKHQAGYGEEPDEYIEKANPVRAQQGDKAHDHGIDDDTTITMKSGELRKVIDAYRKYVRYAREGHIPAQEERFQLHQSVRAVKHLIRKPHHGRRDA